MRCLYQNCPMSNKDYCPARLVCPDYKHTITLTYPKISQNNSECYLNLSPSEAVELYTRLSRIVSYIDDVTNPPKYWPPDKENLE